ncbi:hypothetical protein SEVIR_8G202501v4 [Setaria viridis]
MRAGPTMCVLSSFSHAPSSTVGGAGVGRRLGGEGRGQGSSLPASARVARPLGAGGLARRRPRARGWRGRTSPGVGSSPRVAVEASSARSCGERCGESSERDGSDE